MEIKAGVALSLSKGYKQTEVGVIAGDWEVKELSDIGEIATGTPPPHNNKNNYGEDYFFTTVERSVKTEMERISQRLTQRIKELAERYETPLPKQTKEVKLLEDEVTKHLEAMGFKI